MVFLNSLRKLITALLLLVLPLQGIAAAFAPLHSALNASANSAMPCHDHAAHHGTQTAAHETAASEHAPVDAPRDADAVSHLCCHQVFTCATITAPTAPAHKFGDVPRFVPPLATLFIPDSPDRPPRG